MNSKLHILILSVIVILLYLLLLGFELEGHSIGDLKLSDQKFATDNSPSTLTNIVYQDNMNGANDTTALKSRGYKIYNRGTSPIGTSAVWFQGSLSYFSAYEGPSTGYVACNYRVASYASTIDSWLVTPRINVFNGDTLSFYSRSRDNSSYPDSFRVMYSSAGDSVPEANWTELGRFRVGINGWTLRKFVVHSSGYGRFAIRYRLANGGPGGTTGDFAGIDVLQVTRGGGNCQLTWSQKLTVSDAGNGFDSLRFGTSYDGSNGIDSCLGEYSMPPVPPSGAFDCRFALPNNEASRFDIRNDSLVNREWRVTFQASSTGYPFTFSWNPSTLPAAGLFTLKDEVNGSLVNVNMRNQTSYTLTNTGVNSLRIVHQIFAVSDVPVNAGWNIVSVPVLATNMTWNILFPGVASPAYGYDNGYISVTELLNEKGYWMKFNRDTSYVVVGNLVQPERINVNQGWNLIGPFDKSMAVSSIQSVPAGIISSPFYGYSNGYYQADTLKPGIGYWIRAGSDGYLYDGSADNTKNFVTGFNPNDYAELSFTSSSGSIAKLFLSKSVDLEHQSPLPPLPPSGIFDVRFATQNAVEKIGVNQQIEISSPAGSTKLKLANANGTSLRIRDAVNGQLLNEQLIEGVEITILENIQLVLLESDHVIPEKFELGQNYPNPFNPSTTIKYQLPKSGNVALKIFDALGREMIRLVDDFKAPGTYEVSFNASDFASGVYFYKIETDGFADMKKMIILK